MKTNEVKLGKDGKPVIFEDFETGEKFVMFGNFVMNLKSELFEKNVGQWVLRTDNYQLKPIPYSDNMPNNAELLLH